MDEKFNAILSIAIIPEVISLISKNENIDEIRAINEFYDSKVYSLLSDESTKIWHYSPLTIYHMWKEEKTTGEIIFPEEAA